MSNIFCLSDTHYGHTNICGPKVSNWDKGYRDFDTIHEMNETIIKSINDTVKENDTLYHLGDWSFGGYHNIWNFRKRIQCKDIRLVFGNHDHHIRTNKILSDHGLYSEYGLSGIEYKGLVKAQDLFTSCNDYYELKYRKTLIIMSHYAFRVWNRSHRGSLHVFGHSHHSLPEYGRSMDVGWCKYRRPLHIDEIYDILSKRPINFVDHHDKETNV